MSSENIDYSAVLADLVAKRDDLNAAIKAVERIVGVTPTQSNTVATGAPSNGTVSENTEIRRDTFFQMSIPDAAKKFLAMSKAAKTTQEIAEALERGGMTHASGNFANSVGSVLHRLDHAGGDILRVGRGTWGLAEWYPGRRRTKASKLQELITDVENRDAPQDLSSEASGEDIDVT